MKSRTNYRPTMVVMVILGVLSTVATVLLRVWLLPAHRDFETGLYRSHYGVILLMLGTLLALGLMGILMHSERHEIVGRSAKSLSIFALLCGVVMGVYGVLDGLTYFGIIGENSQQEIGLITVVSILQVLQAVFGVLGGAALVRLGLTIAAEGATRRGMAQWSMLAPVMWIWIRLVTYEMSYASMVRLEDSFFGVVMFIMELLFLFKLARYTAGVGRVSAGMLLFYSMGTALFALSGPATRVGMYLLGDSEAFVAYHLAGPVDFAIGVLALVVSISLLFSVSTAQVEESSSATDDVLVGGFAEDEDDPEEEAPEEEAPEDEDDPEEDDPEEEAPLAESAVEESVEEESAEEAEESAE